MTQAQIMCSEYVLMPCAIILCTWSHFSNSRNGLSKMQKKKCFSFQNISVQS